MLLLTGKPIHIIVIIIPIVVVAVLTAAAVAYYVVRSSSRVKPTPNKWTDLGKIIKTQAEQPETKDNTDEAVTVAKLHQHIKVMPKNSR